MDIDLLDRIKRLTIAALVSDDILMGILVLKGGNALGIAYDITNRGSIDIDFSIENDFSTKERESLKNQSESLLNSEFNKEGLQVFDVKFIEKPKKIDESVRDFWGGYQLEFKVIQAEKFTKNKENLEELRRTAITIKDDHSRKFTVDISKYEFIGKANPKDIDGSTVYVYSPEMLAIEKLRALCQQVEEYKEIVIVMTKKSRARDFYDIYNLTESFNIDFNRAENSQLLTNIFAAKKVPLNFITKLSTYRELHRDSWGLVLQTINPEEKLKEFDFYFDYVLDKFRNYA
jgi:predicted nucleotidyltransferase component of viral defense system